eukprot:TRINITY_DN23754_c0_g1_i1.p1 TRINITY_DN23754_c0_g1~~TRINITY_DN23754_c0_g1_i1.p1  ORF type:complete len:186 (-),score=27.37 TRINITY_DN23754_c0_g1_i1:137-631(-)
MRALCHLAVHTDLVTEQDVIYSAGELMLNPRMFFVIGDGNLHYIQNDFMISTEQGVCINEPVLWIGEWTQMGSLQAQKPSYVLSVIVLEALKVLSRYRTKRFYPGLYARQFVKEIKDADISKVSDISSDYMYLNAIVEKVFEDLQARSVPKFSLLRRGRRHGHD